MFVSVSTLITIILVAYLLGIITTPILIFTLIMRPASIQAENKRASSSPAD